MPTWPGTLPQLVLTRGFSETAPWAVLRTDMDTGPAKTRRRSTAAPRPLSAQIKVTKAQVAVFDAFLETDLAGGALAFDWVEPRTQAAATLRLTAAPTYEPTAGGSSWTITLPLEVLPS